MSRVRVPYVFWPIAKKSVLRLAKPKKIGICKTEIPYHSYDCEYDLSKLKKRVPSGPGEVCTSLSPPTDRLTFGIFFSKTDVSRKCPTIDTTETKRLLSDRAKTLFAGTTEFCPLSSPKRGCWVVKIYLNRRRRRSIYNDSDSTRHADYFNGRVSVSRERFSGIFTSAGNE